jgi:hypothetical protein
MNNPGVLVERVFFRTMSVQTKKVPGRYGSPPRMVSVFVQDRTERLFRTKPNNKMIANLNNTSSINNVSESLARNNYRLERLEFLFENFRTADQWHVVLANIDRSTNLSYVAFDFSWGNVHRYTVPPAATEAIKQFFRILLQARSRKLHGSTFDVAQRFTMTWNLCLKSRIPLRLPPRPWSNWNCLGTG